MPRNAYIIIKNNAIVSEELRDATSKLTLGLIKEIKLEAVGIIKPASANKLKKANIKNPLHILKTSAANVSKATGEPVSNALKYVSNAEKLTVDVANSVSEELEKAVKSIAKKLKKYNISETKVRSIVKGII